MRNRWIYLLILSAFAFGAVLTAAQAASPSLEGLWTGSGTVSYKGAVDPVRCRVRYTKSGGQSFTYTSTCATENGRYELTGYVASSGGNRFTGSVSAANHKETGKVLLFQRGKTLSVTVTSGKGSARVSLSKR